MQWISYKSRMKILCCIHKHITLRLRRHTLKAILKRITSFKIDNSSVHLEDLLYLVDNGIVDGFYTVRGVVDTSNLICRWVESEKLISIISDRHKINFEWVFENINLSFDLNIAPQRVKDVNVNCLMNVITEAVIWKRWFLSFYNISIKTGRCS